MSEYSVNADKRRGKRLEKSLEKLMPDKSWRARSQLLQIPDSTVIGWRNGREIPCSGLARLFSVGCDIVYILTGKEDPEHVVTHKYSLSWMEPDEVLNDNGEVVKSRELDKTDHPSESGRRFDIEPIDIVFSLQKSLAGFQLLLAETGRYVADGRSLKGYEDLPGLIDTIQGVKDLCESVSKRLEAYRQDDENHSRPA